MAKETRETIATEIAILADQLDAKGIEHHAVLKKTANKEALRTRRGEFQQLLAEGENNTQAPDDTHMNIPPQPGSIGEGITEARNSNGESNNRIKTDSHAKLPPSGTKKKQANGNHGRDQDEHVAKSPANVGVPALCHLLKTEGHEDRLRDEGVQIEGQTFKLDISNGLRFPQSETAARQMQVEEPDKLDNARHSIEAAALYLLDIASLDEAWKLASLLLPAIKDGKLEQFVPCLPDSVREEVTQQLAGIDPSKFGRSDTVHFVLGELSAETVRTTLAREKSRREEAENQQEADISALADIRRAKVQSASQDATDDSQGQPAKVQLGSGPTASKPVSVEKDTTSQPAMDEATASEPDEADSKTKTQPPDPAPPERQVSNKGEQSQGKKRPHKEHLHRGLVLQCINAFRYLRQLDPENDLVTQEYDFWGDRRDADGYEALTSTFDLEIACLFRKGHMTNEQANQMVAEREQELAAAHEQELADVNQQLTEARDSLSGGHRELFDAVMPRLRAAHSRFEQGGDEIAPEENETHLGQVVERLMAAHSDCNALRQANADLQDRMETAEECLETAKSRLGKHKDIDEEVTCMSKTDHDEEFVPVAEAVSPRWIGATVILTVVIIIFGAIWGIGALMSPSSDQPSSQPKTSVKQTDTPPVSVESQSRTTPEEVPEWKKRLEQLENSSGQ